MTHYPPVVGTPLESAGAPSPNPASEAAHDLALRRAHQQAVLAAIAGKALILESPAEFLGVAADLLRSGFDFDLVQIWTSGLSGDQLRLCGYSQRPGRPEVIGPAIPQLVENCGREKRLICEQCAAPPGPVPEVSPVTTRAAVPVPSNLGLAGVLSVETNRQDGFVEDDIAALSETANLVSSALGNLRRLERTHQATEMLQALLTAAKDVAILSADFNGYVVTASEGTRVAFRRAPQELRGCDIITLFSDADFQRQLSVFIAGEEPPILDRTRLPQKVGKTEIFLNVNLQKVCDSDRRSIGFLCVATDVTENVHLERRLEELSITDELTGLFNQRHFLATLETEAARYRRYRRVFALCFIDLDGFKKYNDAHGHRQGDRVLKETADILRSQVRSNVDLCFRYGGDEFVILMPETTALLGQIPAERLRAKLEKQFSGAITASVGISEWDGEGSPENLIRRADEAMYASKAAGGNRVMVGIDPLADGE